MIRIIKGDITRLDVDIIVNAANQALAGGGGVDEAIHRAAGPELAKACSQIPEVSHRVRCPTGEVRVTLGFDLPAQWIIHTVGPVWHGGKRAEAEELAACYRNSLAAAVELEAKSIAFPAISTGIYGFPKELAAEIAIREIKDFLSRHKMDVILCAYNDKQVAIYEKLLSKSA